MVRPCEVFGNPFFEKNGFFIFCRSCCERGRSCVLQMQMEVKDFNREIVPLRDRMFRFAQSLLLDRDE